MTRPARLPVVLFGLSLCLSARPAAVAASESATASVTVSAHFSSRTSLKVSTQLLHFEVTASSPEALATVDFSAGARTVPGGEVVLTVEEMGTHAGPGGAADVETSLTFSGEGDGLRPGQLRASTPSVAGRWAGSGLRTGRLTFALRSPVPGSYAVPVRFVLSAP